MDLRVDGEQMVVLPLQEYQTLLAGRRQLGGQSARVRKLRAVLTEVLEFLEALEERLHRAASDQEPEELAVELRQRVERARRISGLSPMKRQRDDVPRDEEL
ncbi:hypothetical protein [Streptomyces tanashiensis]|uniref:hypothetical protein n=1 Tax=Streptomyces tanashiensis TaxID=67367 RepID=UPI0033EFBF54